jgi:hypothetical protein
MNEETQIRTLTVGHGLGIWLLLLVAEVIVAGISMMFFGFHVMVMLQDIPCAIPCSMVRNLVWVFGFRWRQPRFFCFW